MYSLSWERKRLTLMRQYFPECPFKKWNLDIKEMGITLWEEVLCRTILKEGPRTFYIRHAHNLALKIYINILGQRFLFKLLILLCSFMCGLPYPHGYLLPSIFSKISSLYIYIYIYIHFYIYSREWEPEASFLLFQSDVRILLAIPTLPLWF